MSLKSRNFVLGDVRFPSEGHPISLIPEIVGDKEDNIGQDVATTISTSEISTFLRANGLKAVRNSIITNGDFNQIDEINDSVCEFVSLDGKDNKILNGYNSVDRGENNNISQTINDLEIL